jgi:uncharacterized protein YkwD
VSKAEEKVVSLINAYRRAHKLSTLMPHDTLHNVSQIQSTLMRDRDYFDHRDFIARIGGGWTKAGEVIAKIDLPIDSPERVVEGWKKSPPHRRELLGDFQFIGISRVANEKEAFWTANLGR